MDEAKQRLHRRRLAYLRTFCDEKGNPHDEAKRVLADLKRFCGIDRGGLVVSPVSKTVDSHATVYRAALRDVYLRIRTMIQVDETEVKEDNDHAGTSSSES